MTGEWRSKFCRFDAMNRPGFAGGSNERILGVLSPCQPWKLCDPFESGTNQIYVHVQLILVASKESKGKEGLCLQKQFLPKSNKSRVTVEFAAARIEPSFFIWSWVKDANESTFRGAALASQYPTVIFLRTR